MSNIVDFRTGKTTTDVAPPDVRVATDVVKEMMDVIAKDNVPYSRAVVVLLNDTVPVGYRVACYNTPAFTALGMLAVASSSITDDMMGGGSGGS